MAGRPPKSPHLHLIDGTSSQTARGKPGMPVDPAYLDDLTAPAHLSDNAKVIWDDLAPKLRQYRLLTVLDVFALERYCVDFARWREHVAASETARVLKNAETGSLSASPHVNIAQMYGNNVERGERKFMLNPADRSSARINPQGDLFEQETDAKPKAGTSRFFKT